MEWSKKAGPISISENRKSPELVMNNLKNHNPVKKRVANTDYLDNELSLIRKITD